MPRIRIFVSSPGDVEFERKRVERVVERLNGDLAQVARLETVLWESRFYKAHETFQRQIPEAADCDVVVAVFWARLGTELPPDFPRMPNGEPYPSGSAYEVLTSIETRRNRDRPDVFVFRKSAPPTFRIDRKNELAEAQTQWERLESFFTRWFRTSDGHFLGGYQWFETTDEFEAKVEKLLRSWIEERILHDRAVIWPTEIKGSPFRGLAPFDAKHAAVFFGRDRKVARAVDQLKTAAQRGLPFLVIVGPSGAGKSSLMRAGLMPRLTTPGVVPDIDLWRVAVMRPGDGRDPFGALARALFVTGEADDAGGFGRALPELHGGSGGTPEPFARLLEQEQPSAVASIVTALDRVAAEERRRGRFERAVHADLLLLVDQLEEIFASTVTGERRAAFARLLAALGATARVWVVATLRADLYDRLIADRAFVALKDRGQTYDLAPPGAAELTEIVRKSAEAAGLVYETDPVTGERLDERLLREAEGEDVLPLLQFTLNRLFDRRQAVGAEARLTISAYEDLGGLDGAIDQAAEQALGGVGAAEIEALPRLLRLLAVPVRRDGSAATSRGALTVSTVRYDEAVPKGADPNDPTCRLVGALVEARILLASRSEPGKSATLRIAHERVLSSWKRARWIIQEHQDFYRIRGDAEQQRLRWEASGRRAELLIPPGSPLNEAERIASRYGDELSEDMHGFIKASVRRAHRRQRAMALTAAVFAVLAVVAGLLGWRADQAKREAETMSEAARGTVDKLITAFAERLRDRDGIAVKTVDEVLKLVNGLVDDLKARSQGDPRLDATDAAMHYQFAQTYHAGNHHAAALAEAKRSLGIRRRLAEREPSGTERQLDLALSLQQVGDYDRELDDVQEARELYAEARSILRRLAERFPDDKNWAYRVSQSMIRTGDLELKAGNMTSARASYEEALHDNIGLIRHDPGNGIWQRELSWSLNKVGDTYMRGAEPAVAQDYYDHSLCVRRHIAEQNPGNTLYQLDVSWALDRRGQAKRRMKDLPGAERDFYEELVIRRRLVERDRDNTRWRNDLASSLHQIGDLKLEAGDVELAFAFLQAALEIREQLAQRSPDDKAALAKAKESAGALSKARNRLDDAGRGLSEAALRARVETEVDTFIGRLSGERREDGACWNELFAHLDAIDRRIVARAGTQVSATGATPRR